MSKILVFAGSARSTSLNKKLAAVCADKIQQLGSEATLIDLRDYPLPLYDGDAEQEQGLPDNAIKLRDLLIAHDGILLACPEYNGSITPLLKNLIDWTSRPSEDVASLIAYKSKVAALVSASPGALGGMRGLVHVRAILSGIGVHVIPYDASIGAAHTAFEENGAIADERQEKRLAGVLEALVETTDKLHT